MLRGPKHAEKRVSKLASSGKITRSDAEALKALIRGRKRKEVVRPLVGERTIAHPGASVISPAERRRIDSKSLYDKVFGGSLF